jgi:hypothetical protein
MPTHDCIRLRIGESTQLPRLLSQLHITTDGKTVNITEVGTRTTFKEIKTTYLLPITAHPNFGIAHSEQLNLDVVVIPREISEAAVFDTNIPDENGQTHLKTGNLRVNRDESWSLYGRYGPIAAGSSGSQVPIKISKPCCTICGKKVPKRSIEDLIQLEWTGIEIKRDDGDGKMKEKAYICPAHTHEEIMAFMGSAIEHGKMPRTRAHCIKVRGGERNG